MTTCDLDDSDEVAEVAVGDGITLRMAQCCVRLLIWDCSLPKSAHVERLLGPLAAQGYRDESRFGWIHELTDGDGHCVVIVPRTGRVQVRVHYLTPFERRRATAQKIAEDIREILGV